MDTPLQLLLIEDNPNEAERLIGTVKSAGFLVRSMRIDSEDDLLPALRGNEFAVVLLSLTAAITLERLMSVLDMTGQDIPVIALGGKRGHNQVDCLQAGAYDLVVRDNAEHLKLVVRRAVLLQQRGAQLRRCEATLREAERRLKSLIDNSRDAIAYVHDGMHLYANDSYLSLIGHSNGRGVEGTPIMDLVVREDQERLKEFLRSHMKDPNHGTTLSVRLIREGGEPLPVEMELSQAFIEGEPCTQVLIRDNNRTHELEKRLSFLSQRDLITGLYNRRYFIEQLEQAAGAAVRNERNSGLIEIRIANFDEIRGRLGVAGCDLVMAEIGRVLESACTQGEIVAHLEGASFVILTTRWKTEDLERFIRDLVMRVGTHIYEIHGRSIACTASGAGVAVMDRAPDANELISRVQTACSQALSEGTNKVVIYRPRIGEMSQKELDAHWCERVRHALLHEQFRLAFQAIVGLRGDVRPRFDVYLRMIDRETKTSIRPREFLPSAERCGMAVAIDRWVIAHSLAQMARTMKRHSDVLFFIRLSAGAFSDPQIVSWIVEQIRSQAIPAEQIVFKMKEDTVVSHLRQAKDLIKTLRALHCRVALDGFGTGLDPFQITQHIAVDYLKLDAVFMERLSDSHENQESLRQLTHSAHACGQTVIAPNVEEAASLAILWNTGIDFAEGYFLQRPTDIPDYDFSSLG